MILKLFKNIFTCVGILALGCIFQSCASFPDLPKNLKPSSEIVGIYSNDCDSAWGGGASESHKLWRLVDPDSKDVKVWKDSSFIRFEITNDNQLKALLIQNSEVVLDKIIEGEFEEDQSYYTPRSFFIFPLFPILVGWENEKERIYRADNYLVFERIFHNGGFFFMAGSNSTGNPKWIFRKIE